MFRIIVDSLRTGIITEGRPFALRPPFGFPVIDFTRCTLCEECARSCPTGAIHTETRRAGPADARAFVCRLHPVPGVRGRVPRAGHFRRTGRWRWPRIAASSWSRPRPSMSTRRRALHVPTDGSQSGPSLEESAARLRERIRGRLGRSLHVRQVDAGSCNGCELEIAATTNPMFDLERFGIHFVASPRHADVLLVTGPVTRNMEIGAAEDLRSGARPSRGRRSWRVWLQRRHLW